MVDRCLPGVTPEPNKSPASFPVWRTGLQQPPEGSPAESAGSASPLDAATNDGRAHVLQMRPGAASQPDTFKTHIGSEAGCPGFRSWYCH